MRSYKIKYSITAGQQFFPVGTVVQEVNEVDGERVRVKFPNGAVGTLGKFRLEQV